jgi:hypothetical protein
MEKDSKLTPELRQTLEEIGYIKLKEVNGKIIGIMRYMYTVAIVVDIDYYGYNHRFCYPHERAMDCLMAFEVYNGEGDPMGGWIKQKGAGVDRINPAIGKSANYIE